MCLGVTDYVCYTTVSLEEDVTWLLTSPEGARDVTDMRTAGLICDESLSGLFDVDAEVSGMWSGSQWARQDGSG